MERVQTDRTFKNIIQELTAGDFLGRFVFVLMIMAGLLIFGCVGAPAEQPPAQETEGVTAPAEETGEVEETPPAGEGAPATGGTTDYSGMAYLELAALGVPVVCDITTTYQGETTTARMYMQGENKIRYESSYDGKEMIMITLGEITYMTNFMADEYPQCAWIKMEPEEQEPGEPTEYDAYATTPDFEEMPDTSFECSPWRYDESKFAVPTTNVCTMDEFTDLMMEGFDIPDYQ